MFIFENLIVKSFEIHNIDFLQNFTPYLQLKWFGHTVIYKDLLLKIFLQVLADGVQVLMMTFKTL